MRILFILLLTLTSIALYAQADIEKAWQTQFILAEPGDTIEFPAGSYSLSNTLWLDAKKDIVIRGAGQEETVISFKNQKQGAEGIKITNSENILLENFTVEDSKGDLIKTQEVKGITFRSITARWTGKPSKHNGAYALYPVQCSRVRIEYCTAIGASDAGIYVGQSDSIWVENCVAKYNVAGIEIENSTNAWVTRNQAFSNTGGILVFDLPDLPKKRGGNVKVWKNQVLRNNYKNFAPKGNIVGKVPPGTGIMILATENVEVYDNRIWENRTASTAIVSYYIAEAPWKDPEYNPYPALISVHDNMYSDGKHKPSWKSKLGFLLWLKFKNKAPHIIYDGIQEPAHLNEEGNLKEERRICIYNNANESFADLDADNNFKNILRDLSPYRCRL